MRKKRPLSRTTNVVRDTGLIIIASEDRYAVKQYFDFFRSTKIQFRILETQDSRSSPRDVLARIDQFKKEYEFNDRDEFWLVSDCDHWIEPNHVKNLVLVLQQCRQKRINVALTNPCFELWLLLHFADFPTETSLTCAEVGQQIRNAAGAFDKTRVYNLPMHNDRVKLAIERSAANYSATSEIPDRPQTSVHRIIEQLVARAIISVGP